MHVQFIILTTAEQNRCSLLPADVLRYTCRRIVTMFSPCKRGRYQPLSQGIIMGLSEIFISIHK